MLWGSDSWEVNNSYPRGFFSVCCACGTNHKIDIYPQLTNHIEESEFPVTGPWQHYVIIECKECDQVVRVNPDGTSSIMRESTYISPTKARETEEEVGQTS